MWVEDPDATPWEIYTVLADAPAETGLAGDGTCCADTELEPVAKGTAATRTCC